MRLHFFNSQFDGKDLFNLVIKKTSRITENVLQKTYLGFIVIKPLPKTFIGRTCLKVYESDEGRRHYPVICQTPVHLLGIDIPIDSIPVQEQDTVAAACATSALWSMFHGTGKLFQHHIPSPIEITKTAIENFPSVGRGLPNFGLEIRQICQAIRKVGLENDFRVTYIPSLMKNIIYGYLNGKIPLLLILAVYDIKDLTNVGPILRGHHAVAVTGYSIGLSSCEPVPETGTLFRSTRIDKIYVHDDQIGPFARLNFTNDSIAGVLPVAEGYPPIIMKSPKENIVYVPESIIIPLYHKIRIPLEVVQQDAVMNIDLGIKGNMAKDEELKNKNIEWDVYLTMIGDLKKDLRENYHGVLPQMDLWQILEKPLPRFIWRAIARIDNKPVLEFWFDATDIEQGNYNLQMVAYDPDFLARISRIPNNYLQRARFIPV